MSTRALDILGWLEAAKHWRPGLTPKFNPNEADSIPPTLRRLPSFDPNVVRGGVAFGDAPAVRPPAPLTPDSPAPALRLAPPQMSETELTPPVAVTPPTLPDYNGDSYLNTVPPPVRRIDNASLVNDRKIQMSPETELETRLSTRPENHNSRLAGVGLGLLRGFARGGLGGALYGGINGAVNKSADEEYANNQRIAQLAPRVKFNQEIQTQNAENAYRRAEAAKLGKTPPVNLQHVETADGIKLLNPQTGEFMETGEKAPVKPEAYHAPAVQIQRGANGVETLMQYNPDKKVWEVAPVAGGGDITRAPKPAAPKIPYRLSTGETVNISPEARASIDAQTVNGGRVNQREADRIAREDSVRADNEALKVLGDNRARAAKARQAEAEFRRLKQQAVSGTSPYKDMTDQQYREYSQQQMLKKWGELQGYPEFFNFQNDPNYPDLAPKQQVSVSEAMRQQKGKSRAQIVDEIKAQNFVPVP